MAALPLQLVTIVISTGDEGKLVIEDTEILQELMQFVKSLWEGWDQLPINHIFCDTGKFSAKLG